MANRSNGFKWKQWRGVLLVALGCLLGFSQAARGQSTAPDVTFSPDTPDTYVKGSGESIDFVVDGELPAGDILVLAWSDDQQQMVDEFAHTVTQAPWQIAADQLDKLPEGRVQLQLLRRVPDAPRTIARQWITVKAPVAPTTDAPSISFPADTPTTYRQGSGEAIPFNMEGTLPTDADVLAIAWSKDENRLVDEYAHTITSEPWEISASQLDKLPAGDVNLQLLLRVPGQSNLKISHDITIQPALPTVSFPSDAATSYTRGSGQSIAFTVDGTMPTDGVVKVTAYSQDQQSIVTTFTHELSAEPWAISASKLDLLPAGQVELRLDRVIPGEPTTTAKHTITVAVPATPDVTVSFSPDTPASYQQGSGGAIPFVVDGTMPDDGDVLVLAWSYDQQRMVDEFAHAVTSAPWEISAANLDKLPAGNVQLQLMRRVPGMDKTIVRQDMEVMPAAQQEPTPLPTVSFASGTPTTYTKGSGDSIQFNVDGELPQDADILAIAWSDGEQRMVDEFAQSFTSEPWTIGADRMETLPTGGTSLQLLLRVPGHDNVVTEHWLTVEAAPTSDGGTSGGDTSGGTTDGGTSGGGTTDGGTGSGDAGSGGGTGTVDAGWTTLNKSSDTRVIYVSSSQGNDNNNGLSSDTPVRTMARGYELMRNGMPDWLLLKRGDKFRGRWYWSKSGRSATEPMVISAYGSGPRPQILPVGDGSTPFRKDRNKNIQHIWMVSLDFYNDYADPNSPTYHHGTASFYAIQARLQSNDFLVEDCKLSFYQQSTDFENNFGKVTNVRFRRNVITDAYSTGSHGCGLFLAQVEGLVIEGNVFDHNGWNGQVAADDLTMFERQRLHVRVQERRGTQQHLRAGR